MTHVPEPSFTLVRSLLDETATVMLGRELALFAAPGDCICLHGDLGTGKTTLARAFIEALMPPAHGGDVPSPTFSLVQTYDETRLEVAHYDFYRLTGPADIEELEFHERLDEVVSLVEWPDRLGREMPEDRLDIVLEGGGDTDTWRDCRLTGHGRMAARLARMDRVNGFLRRHGITLASRAFLQGDASTRRYERITRPGQPPAIVMDMPSRPDGPPLDTRGRDYGQIAHLARDCRAVVAINAHLRARGLCAPETLASDLDAGLLLIEDLGDPVFSAIAARGGDLSDPHRAAVDILAFMAGADWPRQAPVGGDIAPHVIADYDDEAMMIEVELLLDWYWPAITGTPAPEEVRQDYVQRWRALLPLARREPAVWVLRDYHSPNLIWRADRTGLARVGLIDTQDCVMGPPAYDLVSLLQDARIDIARDQARGLYRRYCRQRRQNEAGFNEEVFAGTFAVMGAQRACKILGIFHRLDRRDGKPGYLRHCARVARALAANLGHRDLAGLKDWFDRHLPAITARP